MTGRPSIGIGRLHTRGKGASAILDDSCRIARYHREGWNVTRNHRPRCHNGTSANGYAGKDERALSNPHVVTDCHRLRRCHALVHHGPAGIRENVVGREDHHIRAHHDITPDHHWALDVTVHSDTRPIADVDKPSGKSRSVLDVDCRACRCEQGTGSPTTNRASDGPTGRQPPCKPPVGHQCSHLQKMFKHGGHNTANEGMEPMKAAARPTVLPTHFLLKRHARPHRFAVVSTTRAIIGSEHRGP